MLPSLPYVLNQVLRLAHTADLAAHAHRCHLHPRHLATLHQSTEKERERERQTETVTETVTETETETDRE